MNTASERPSPVGRIGRYAIVVSALWTLVILGFLVWDITELEESVRELALVQARTSFEKDILYRLWNTEHGGLYAPITDRTQPNPYLDVPEREITTPSGRRLTLINPAYMTRQVHEMGAARFGTWSHITSLNPINPKNAPDKWEEEALRSFEAGVKEVAALQTRDDKEYMRIIRPFVTEKGCLKCHAVQGYREGQIRGGISVAVPTAALRASVAGQERLDILTLTALWLLGMSGIIFGFTRLSRGERKRLSAEEELRHSEERFRVLVENAPDAIFVQTHERFAYVNKAALHLFGAGSAEQLLGKSVFDRFHPDYRGEVRERIRLLNEKRSRVPKLEQICLRLDESEVPVETAAVPIAYDGHEGALVFARDITERRDAEVRIDAQRRSYETILESVQDGIWVTGPEHRITYANQGITRISGLGVDRLVGNSVLEDFPEETLSDFRPHYLRAAESLRPTEYEARIVTPAGRETWQTGWLVPMVESGRFAGMICTIQDSTERRRAELQLRESEAKFSSIFSTIDESVVLHELVCDPAGRAVDYRILDCNPAFTRISGIPGERAVGALATEIFDSAEPPYLDIYARVAQTGEPWHFETYFPPLQKHFSVSVVSPVRGRFITVATDITERRKAEESLREREELYSAIVNQAEEGIVLIDPETQDFAEFNDAACRSLGYTREEFEGLKLVDVQGVMTPERVDERLQDLLREGHGRFENRQRRKDGTLRDVHVSNQVVNIRGHKYLVGIWHDITEQKRAEQRQKELEEQLFQAQKMEAIGQLAGGIAHDFNNILTAIVGNTFLASREMESNDPQKTYLDQINAVAQRAATLTQSLLAFSRKQMLEKRLADANVIVRSVGKFIQRIIGEDINLKLVLDNGPLPVMVDTVQLEQVLMNLATNARDAMPWGGELTIRTQRATWNKDDVKGQGHGATGDYVRITVSDTGHGMDQSTMDRIFEPFFTTKEVGRGTGLGLSMVYGIVEQHGGYISVSSDVGRGTTFEIYLPASQTRPSSSGAPAPEEEVIGGQETILIAEDDTEIRNIIRTILGAHGYRVIEATDGQDAIEKFMEKPAGINMVILDVIMPKKNGRQVYDEIRQRGYDVKVLFMSGYPAGTIGKKGILEEGLHFMQKPVSPVTLLKTVRRVLDELKGLSI